MRQNKMTYQQVQQAKTDRMLDGAAYWGAFYRENPQRFAKEYLNVNLKLFQKIILYTAMHSTNFIYLASRGQGKSWLLALLCVIKCILYPGTKICVAAGVKSQSMEIITKISDEFAKNYGWGSENLRNEIAYISTSINNPACDFKNGSYIHIVTANENSRHNRANCILCDEFRMIDPDIINTVLRRFLTAPRHPGYLDDPKYSNLQERNCELYASSAWYKAHWSFEKTRSYFANMLDDKRQYGVVALPYQLALKEGLLSREALEDEMSEDDFDPIAWEMEMGCLFYGQSDGAFFRYDDIAKRRKIKNAFHPLELYQKRGINIPELAVDERRILSVDVALMATRKHANDATAIGISVNIPTENQYLTNLVYVETFEGLTTDEVATIVMRYFYEYKCTDLVLDTNGNGLGVYDAIIKPIYDETTGVTYEPLKSCNDEAMAERCKYKNAAKCVWTIKASAEFNSNVATSLRSGIQNGNVNFLISSYDAESTVEKISGYSKMTTQEQTKLLLPYVQTDFLVNEMINLEHDIVNNKVKLREKSGMRKDRASMLQYMYYVAQSISRSTNKKSTEREILDMITIRPAQRTKH